MYDQSSNYLESYSNCESSVIQLLYKFNIQKQTYNFHGSTSEIFGQESNNSLNLSFKNWFELIHPEDRLSVKKTIKYSCDRYEKYHIRYRIKLMNGSYKNFQDTGYISRQNSRLDSFIIGTIIEEKNNAPFSKKKELFNTELINSSIHEGVFQIDNTGIIRYWNIAAQTIFGYNRDEIIGKHFHILFKTDFDNGFQNSLKLLLETGKEDIAGKFIELEAIRKDNALIPIELRISSIFINEKRNAVIVVRDISERKLRDKIIRETMSLEKLVTSISSRFVGNFDFDIMMYYTLRDIGIERNIDRAYLVFFNKNLSRFDYTYEWCNEGIESHLSYYKKTPIKKYPWVLQRLMNRQYLEISNLADIPAEGNKFKQDLIKNNIKCTLACPIMKNENLIGCIGFDIEIQQREWNFNDRTLLQFSSQTIANALERKRSEDKLKESEKRYKSLFKTAPLMIILFDFNGIIVDVNKKVCDSLDLKKEELIGRNILDLNLIRKEKLPLFQGKLKELLKNDFITPVEVPVLSDNFKLNWVRLYASLISINNKSLVQIIMQDISQKKRAELELVDSERKYRNIFDSAMDAIFLLDHDKIVDANRTAVKMYGFNSKSDFIGISPWNLSPYYQPNGRKSKDLALEYIESGLKGEPLTFTWHHIKNNGKLFDAEISLNRQKHGKEYLLQAIVRDISEKVKSEKELIDSKKQFQSIIESIGDALHVIDHNFKIIYNNTTLSKWLDSYNFNSNVIGNDVRNEFSFISRKIEKECRHVFNTGKSLITIEEANVKNDILYLETRRIPLISDGKVKYIVSIIRDITNEKKAESVLKASEKKFRTLFETIRDGIVLLNTEGNVIESNQAFLDLIEYSFNEVKSSNISKFIKSDKVSNLDYEIKKLMKNEGYIEKFEELLIKKNGSLIPVSIVLWNLKEAKEKEDRIWAIIRDISERKRAIKLQEKFEESLKNEVVLRTNELNQALKNQKKYLDHIVKSSQFKSEFLASMSHELRTPLNAIIGFTDLLLEESYGKMNKTQLEFISDIQDSSNHLLDMITRILDISKIESGKLSINLENFNLYNLIHQIISTFKPLTQKRNLKLEHNFFDKNRVIQADRVKLKQILYNLIGNAVKFTIKGKICIEFSEDGDNWTFNIKDTGIGIAKKDFDKIFKDFQRVKSPYVNSVPGSGLGLALTKRLVNLHGGTITFESRLGGGSTFFFTIPKKYKDKTKSDRVNDFLNALS